MAQLAALCPANPETSGSNEAFAVIYFDDQGGVADIHMRTDHDSSRVFLSARKIVHEALTHGHERFILIHNHPSGNPRPSPADIAATRLLSRTAAALDLELIDHLIVAPQASFSFRAAGLI